MKTITRAEYTSKLRAAGDNLSDHVTEGANISVIQWLDAGGTVVLQAVYSHPVAGTPVIVTYYSN